VAKEQYELTGEYSIEDRRQDTEREEICRHLANENNRMSDYREYLKVNHETPDEQYCNEGPQCAYGE